MGSSCFSVEKYHEIFSSYPVASHKQTDKVIHLAVLSKGKRFLTNHRAEDENPEAISISVSILVKETCQGLFSGPEISWHNAAVSLLLSSLSLQNRVIQTAIASTVPGVC